MVPSSSVSAQFGNPSSPECVREPWGFQRLLLALVRGTTVGWEEFGKQRWEEEAGAAAGAGGSRICRESLGHGMGELENSSVKSAKTG